MPGGALQKRWPQQRDAIVALIGAACVGGGKLASVLRVEKTIPIPTGVWPAIGVNFVKYEEQAFDQSRRWYLTYFDIAVLVDQAFLDGVASTGAAAKAALDALVNDGAGNGLDNVLVGPGIDRTLGGVCLYSYIESVQTNQLPETEAAAGTQAVAQYRFVTEDQYFWR
jgi:hypothetical protein